MIKNLKPATQAWGKIEETQHLTSVGASAVSQGCTAGSEQSRKPRAAQRASSCKASSGKTLFDLPSSQRSCFLHLRAPAPEETAEVTGICPHWTDEVHGILRDPDLGQGHTGSQHGQVRTSIEATVLAEWDHNNPHPHPTPTHIRTISSASPLSAGSLRGRLALCCGGVRFLPKLSEFKGPWMVWDLDSTSRTRGSLSHKDFFIL